MTGGAGGWPLLAALLLASAVQKLCNNYEGLTKVLVRGHLAGPTEGGGLGLGPAAAGAFLTAAALGYFIKPMFGLVTDRLPVFGYRRRSWLVLASLATSAAWVWVAVGGAADAGPLLAALLVVNVTVTFSDVVCDGLMVEAGRRAERDGAAAAGTGNRPLQVAQWAGALAAMLVAAAAGGLLARYATLSHAAWASAALPLLTAVAALVLVREERVAWDWRAARGGFAAVGLAAGVGAAVLALKRYTAGTPFEAVEPFLSPALVLGAVLLVARVPRSVLAPAVLVIAWPCLPFKADSQYLFQYLTCDNAAFVEALGCDAGVPGAVRRALAAVGLDDGGDAGGFARLFYGLAFLSVELVAGTAGLAVLGRYGQGVPLRWLLAGCLAGWAVALAAYAGLPALASPGYLLACAAVSGLATWVGGTAVLFYAASRVPDGGPGGQATVFALLMGLSNLGGLFGVETVGGRLYQGFAEAGGPDDGLRAVLAASAAYLVVLAAVLAWLARRGELDPPRPPR